MNPNQTPAHRHITYLRPAARGVTLIEAVLSLAILGIIMASIGAATSVLMRLMPRADDPRTVAIAAGSLLERFDSDTAAAIAILDADDDELRMRVAGLGDAGTPATVVYTYDADQSAILRTIDAETPRTLLTGLSNAAFEYNRINRYDTEPIDPVIVDSKFGTDAINCNNFTLTLESGQALRQRLSPTLDDDATLWRIESISMRLKQHVMFGGGTCHIAFYYMNDDGTMHATPFARRSVSISTLTSSLLSAGWHTYEFEGMPWVQHDEPVAVLLSAAGGSFRTHAASLPGHPAVEIYNISDGSAAAFPGHLLCFELSGSAMTPGVEPDPIELIRGITLRIEHPILAQPVLHDARPPVPVIIQP